MSRERDAIDASNPRSILEALESEEDAQLTPAAREQTFRHVMAWVLEGKTLIAVATRCYVAAYVSCPDVVEGMTLHQIGQLSGKGRQAAHNLARDFEDTFGVKSIHARSEIDRKNYSRAFHERNGVKPHSYNPKQNTQ